MTVKLYVICEAGFEYNDEIYHRPDRAEGGRPVISSTNFQKISKKCEEMNIERFVEEFSDIGRYFYSYEDAFSAEAIELIKKHSKSDLDDSCWDDCINPKDFPEDVIRELAKGYLTKWYEVYEVEESI